MAFLLLSPLSIPNVLDSTTPVAGELLSEGERMSGMKSFRGVMVLLLLGLIACGKEESEERVPGMVGEQASSLDSSNNVLSCEIRAELGTTVRYSLSGNELTLKRGTRTSVLTRQKGSKASDIYDTWTIPQARIQDDPLLTVDAVLTIRPNEVEISSHCETSSLAADVALSSKAEISATDILFLESKTIRKRVSN